MTQAVVLEGITKHFGDFVAVDDLSFDVRRGEIFGFLGPNGSGKSTTIRMICGILEPTQGSVRVLGKDAVRHRRQVVNQIGYMSQKFSLYPSLTVEENLKFYAGVYGIRGTARSMRVSELLEEHGLANQRSRITRDLPVGWKQRLALAGALLHKPSILFLDEPTGGVDPSSRRVFWDIIANVAEAGTTVFVTTHYMDEAEYCDRIGLIHRARLIALGEPDELKRKTIHGRVFEVTLPDAISYIDNISGHPQVDDVTIYGKDLHVIIKPEVEDSDEVFDALMAKGIPTTRSAWREIPPSLEDVFVMLMK